MGLMTGERGSHTGQLLLIINDDPAEAALIVDALTAIGYTVTTRPDGLRGLLVVEEHSPALIILDWALPFLTGESFLFALRTGLPRPPPVVVLADHVDEMVAMQAAGPHTVLLRPVDPAVLLSTVQRLLEETTPADG